MAKTKRRRPGRPNGTGMGAQILIVLTPELKRELQRVADDASVSQSHFARDAITKAIQSYDSRTLLNPKPRKRVLRKPGEMVV